MAFGLDLFEDFFYLAVGADQEGGALDAHELASVHALLFPHSVGFADGMIRIGHEGEGQIVFHRELLLGVGFIGRDADDAGFELGEFLGGVAKLAGFFGAARGVGLGEEEEHHAAAAQFRKLKSVDMDCRGPIARLEWHKTKL